MDKKIWCYSTKKKIKWRYISVVDKSAHNGKVEGSIPSNATKIQACNSVGLECKPDTFKVGGSNPSMPTKQMGSSVGQSVTLIM